MRQAMRILVPGSRQIAAITGKRIDPEKNYRPSAYTFHYSENGISLLRNNMTGMTAALSEEETALLDKARKEPVKGSQMLNGLDVPTEEHFLLLYRF